MGIANRLKTKGKRSSDSTRTLTARFEPLEQRLLLDATPEAEVSYIQHTYKGVPAVYDFEMHYEADSPIDLLTLDSSDIRVVGPGYDQTATYLGPNPFVDPRNIRAVYRIPAPGGSWNAADNGAYTLIMQPGQVADTLANFVPTQALKVVTVDFDTDSGDFDVDLTYIQDPYHGTPADLNFQVRYRADHAIDLATLGSTDIRVIGPGYDQNATYLGPMPVVDPRDVRAVYRINPPGGAWDSGDNGAYTMSLQGGEVADVDLNWAPAQALKTTIVDLETGSADFDVDVTYIQNPYHGTPGVLDFELRVKGDNPINVGSLDSSDILVTGPNGYSQTATFLGPHPVIDPRNIKGVYRIGAPGGTWNNADNGVYTLALQGGEIADTLGHTAAAQTLETTVVDIPLPRAYLACIQDPYHGTPAVLDFSVRYASDLGINVGTLDSTDIEVKGPNGYDLFATYLGPMPFADLKTIYGIYRVTAPGGFTPSNNGDYTLDLAAGAVADIGGDTVLAKRLGDTTVDVRAPEASLQYITDPYKGAPADYDFLMKYKGDMPVDVTTFDSSDILVTGPNGYSQNATYLGPMPWADPREIYAVYRIAAPGGAWDSGDAGNYTLDFQAGQVSDTSSTFAAAGTLRTVTVDISAPKGFISYVTDPFRGQTTFNDFQVRYKGDVPINPATFDSSDILVTGPNGYSQNATYLGPMPWADPHEIRAVYRIDAPGGLWDATDNGAYTLALQGGQVADTAGAFIAAKTLATPDVDLRAPVAHLSYIQDPYHGIPGTLDFQVRYNGDQPINVASLGSTDILVTGPGYSQLATYLGPMPWVDAHEIRGVYRIVAPVGGWGAAANGTYTLMLQAGEVTDLGGNPAAARTLGTTRVDINAPKADLRYIQDPYHGTPATLNFQVQYKGDRAIDLTTLDSLDVRVTGPGGYNQFAAYLGPMPIVDARDIRAVYRINAPGGFWDNGDNGIYTLTLEAGAVTDVLGISVTPVTLGTFKVDIA